MNVTALKSYSVLGGTALAGAFILLPLWSGSLSPNTYAGGRSRDVEARAVRNASSAAVMLGEVRTAMSDIMFIKSERYLHSGVACKPHLQREILSVSGAMAHGDEHACESGVGHESCTGHDHGHGPGHETPRCEVLIPTAEKDFRGVVGYLERQVKPYHGPHDPHTHTDGLELLPWFRVMTVSDPHYVPGYTTGASWLKDRQPEQALAFVEEGILHNPDSFQIRFAKGQILLALARRGSPAGAAPDAGTREMLARAQEAFAQGGQLAMSRWRKENAEETWTDYQVEDALASSRLHVLMEQRFGDPGEAGELARSYLEVIGEDAVLERLAGSVPDTPQAEHAPHG